MPADATAVEAAPPAPAETGTKTRVGAPSTTPATPPATPETAAGAGAGEEAPRRRSPSPETAAEESGPAPGTAAPRFDTPDAFRERLAKLRRTETAPAAQATAPESREEAPRAEETLEAATPAVPAEEGAAPTEPPAASEAEASPPVPAPPRAKEDDRRSAQMAEIRRMLDELKGGGQGDAGAEDGRRGATAGAPDPAGIGRMAPAPEPAPPPRRQDYHDPLRERLLDPEAKARRSADPDAARAGLMRRHQKRTRRRQVAERQRRSRGGFLTGVSLAVLAAGLIVGVYIGAPQIAERFPAAAPALEDYVRTMDDLREQARAFLERVRERIALVIEEFGDG
jgi:hypothetical protein